MEKITQSSKGMTLIEIVITVLIMSLLAMILLNALEYTRRFIMKEQELHQSQSLALEIEKAISEQIKYASEAEVGGSLSGKTNEYYMIHTRTISGKSYVVLTWADGSYEELINESLIGDRKIELIFSGGGSSLKVSVAIKNEAGELQAETNSQIKLLNCVGLGGESSAEAVFKS